MADTNVEPSEKSKKKGLLLPAALTLLCAGAGFGVAYMGIWSPLDMLGTAEAKPHEEAGVIADFIAVPPVQLTIPGPYPRTLFLATMIETDPARKSEVEHLLPRVSDAFNTFLSGIDPLAFDKRGVLEIIRAELVTRTRLVIGEDAVRDVLVTEFRLK